MDEQKEKVLKQVSNPSCSEDILIKASDDNENYTSSRIRCAVALNKNTPKSIIDKLLKDDYRWVREAAASHSFVDKTEIDQLIKTGDRYILKGLANNTNCSSEDRKKITGLLEDETNYPTEYDTYLLKKSTMQFNQVEEVGGNVSTEDITDAIFYSDNDVSWSDYIVGEFHKYDDVHHECGPIDFVDTIVYPDGSEELTSISGAYDGPTEFETGVEGMFGLESFYQIAKCHEYATWEYSFELEYEFNPEYLKPVFSDEGLSGIITSYEYSDDKTDEWAEIEGECIDSQPKWYDIGLYVYINKQGYESVDLPDLRKEMVDKNIDIEDEESILKYLEEKYEVE